MKKRIVIKNALLFAMLELPRISHIPNIEATMHEYIFPLENPNANYFLEYQGTWEKEPIISFIGEA